jgi:hypothetical protein
VIHSLRKGRISVYLQYELTGHSIGAEKFEAEIKDGKAILRLTLRPVDGNQRHDESYLHEHPLKSVDVDDPVVIHGIESHAKARRSEFSSWELQIISRGQLFRVAFSPHYQRNEAREVLTLSVTEKGTSRSGRLLQR